MSTTSKLTLGLTSALTVAGIFYIHYSQVRDRDALHQGIVRDAERKNMKMTKNLDVLRQQSELERVMRRAERQSQAEESKIEPSVGSQ